MPRKPRMYLPGVPSHIIQRGNNRQPCFLNIADYQYYLKCLYDASKRYKAQVHAYVLMGNHVHLLMTPTHKESISQVMQSIGRLYVQHFNKVYQRSGTLWESRHKASLVDEETYLLKCMRYIELNPLRARMVDQPEDYPWSSYLCNAKAFTQELITPHPIYRALGASNAARAEAYAELFQQALSINDLDRIRKSALFSMPTGNQKFITHIETLLQRNIGYAKRGRPGG